ncbi:MAG: AI-2E family transporter [Anaerolineae bacterium]
MISLSPKRRNRWLLWAGLFLLIGGMIWAARHVLFPYILALILAYLLLPVVNWLDRHMPVRIQTWRMARPLAILLTYLLVLFLVVGVMAFFMPLIVDQVKVLIEKWPTLTSQVEAWGTRGWGLYTDVIESIETISPRWRDTIETGLENLASDLLIAIQSGLFATIRTVSSTVSFLIGLIVIPFWLFYILHDESQVKRGVIQALPLQLRADVQCMASLIDDVLSAYIRGQLLLCLFVGTLVTLSLWIIGVPFALVLGLIAGAFEVLPYVGPILGAVPAVLVALLSDPPSAIWVVVAFFAIQQVENLLLVPRIAGQSVKLHPALVMVVLVIGNQLAGFWGMLVAVPITAIIRDMFKYLYLRMQDEPLAPEEAMARIRSGQEVPLRV